MRTVKRGVSGNFQKTRAVPSPLFAGCGSTALACPREPRVGSFLRGMEGGVVVPSRGRTPTLAVFKEGRGQLMISGLVTVDFTHKGLFRPKKTRWEEDLPTEIRELIQAFTGHHLGAFDAAFCTWQRIIRPHRVTWATPAWMRPVVLTSYGYLALSGAASADPWLDDGYIIVQEDGSAEFGSQTHSEVWAHFQLPGNWLPRPRHNPYLRALRTMSDPKRKEPEAEPKVAEPAEAEPPTKKLRTDRPTPASRSAWGRFATHLEETDAVANMFIWRLDELADSALRAQKLNPVFPLGGAALVDSLRWTATRIKDLREELADVNFVPALPAEEDEDEDEEEKSDSD